MIVTLLLAMAVTLPTVAVSTQPNPSVDDYTALKADLDTALRNGELDEALELAERINEILEPLHYEILYDMARIHALAGRPEKAYEALSYAVDAGFWDIRRLRDDEAFAEMRRDETFGDTVRGIWAKNYIAMLERPDREEFQKPAMIMEVLDFRPGERVADVGAGSGYFTIPIARAVGPDGQVWAIDVVQEMLDHIEMRMKKEQLTNVILQKVARDDPELPLRGIDTILMVDVLHYISNRAAYAEELRKGLAPGGRLVIIDYKPKPWSERPWGPPPEQQISRTQVDTDLARAGFTPVQVYDFLPEQYFVVYALE
jgi:SAM-dependent methyltransferase